MTSVKLINHSSSTADWNYYYATSTLNQNYPCAIIVYAKERETAQTIGKCTYTLEFFSFSLSINLKSYAVHSAIKVSNSIL